MDTITRQIETLVNAFVENGSFMSKSSHVGHGTLTSYVSVQNRLINLGKNNRFMAPAIVVDSISVPDFDQNKGLFTEFMDAVIDVALDFGEDVYIEVPNVIGETLRRIMENRPCWVRSHDNADVDLIPASYTLRVAAGGFPINIEFA